MLKLPALKGRQVLNTPLKAGFYVHHQTGGHARLFHKEHPDIHVTIPIHSQTLPEKTIGSILKQAKIDDSEFLKLIKR